MRRSGWHLLREAMVIGWAVLIASMSRMPVHAEPARLVTVEYPTPTSSVAEKPEECELTFLARIEAKNGEQVAIVGYIGALYLRDEVPGVAIKIQAARFDGKKAERADLAHAEVKFSGGDTSKFRQIPGEGPHARVLLLTDFARAQEWLLIIFRAFEGLSVSVSGPKVDLTFDLPSVRLRDSEAHAKFTDCLFTATNMFDERGQGGKSKE